MNLKGETNIKLERPEDFIPLDKNEIVVKLEKGEGTLKIEKVGVKQEIDVPESVKKGEDKERQEDGADVVTEIKTENAANDDKKTKGEEPDGTKEVDRADKSDFPTKGSKDEIGKEQQSTEISESSSTKEEVESCERTGEKCEVSEIISAKGETNCGNSESFVNSSVNVEKQGSEVFQDKGEVKVEKKATDEVGDKSVEMNLSTTEQDLQESASSAEKCKPSLSESTVEKKSVTTETSEDVKQVTVSEESVQSSGKVDKETIVKAEDSKEMEGIERFKAMFPELEVMQKLPEIDTTVVTAPEKTTIPVPRPSLDSTVAQLIAHSYQNPIKWPKVCYLCFKFHNIVELKYTYKMISARNILHQYRILF